MPGGEGHMRSVRAKSPNAPLHGQTCRGHVLRELQPEGTRGGLAGLPDVLEKKESNGRVQPGNPLQVRRHLDRPLNLGTCRARPRSSAPYSLSPVPPELEGTAEAQRKLARGHSAELSGRLIFLPLSSSNIFPATPRIHHRREPDPPTHHRENPSNEGRQ